VLFDRYRHTLEELGKQPGTLALIFGNAQNKLHDPANLKWARALGQAILASAFSPLLGFSHPNPDGGP
jgi:hypothetical protein